MLSKALFIRATVRAGFVFTMSEIRMLSGHFTNNDVIEKVNYKQFLSWCTPEGTRTTNSTGIKIPGGGVLSVKRSVTGMIKHLEGSLKRGVDLLSVFGRYDTANIGRISADEFCLALSDLGISSASQKEALDLADRFKAAAGNFVLYRRIVEELLRLADNSSGAADIDIIDVVRTNMMKAKIDPSKLKNAFMYYDRKELGQIHEENIPQAFRDIGIHLKRNEIEALADRYAVGDDGWVQHTAIIGAIESRINEKQLFKGGDILTTRGPTNISDELYLKLKSLFESLVIKGFDFRGEFDKFDDSYTGCVSQADFRDVLQERCRARLNAVDMGTLELAFRDQDDPRKVNHVRMLRAMHPTHTSLSAFSLSEEEIVWSLSETLRQKIRRRCDHRTLGELKRPFRHFARKKGKEKGRESASSSINVMLSTVTPSDLAIAIRDLGEKTSYLELIIRSLKSSLQNLELNSMIFNQTPTHTHTDTRTHTLTRTGMTVSADQEFRLFEIINTSQGAAFTYADFVVRTLLPRTFILSQSCRFD